MQIEIKLSRGENRGLVLLRSFFGALQKEFQQTGKLFRLTAGLMSYPIQRPFF